MKALSLLAPYGLLIVGGEKRVETRSYPPPAAYRGVVAIHHSKRFPDEYKNLCWEKVFNRALIRCGMSTFHNGYRRLVDYLKMPLGCVLGTAELYKFAQVVHGDEPERWHLSDQEIEFGNYGTGRWCWFFRNPRKYDEPIPAKGALGLWTWIPQRDDKAARQAPPTQRKPRNPLTLFPLN